MEQYWEGMDGQRFVMGVGSMARAVPPIRKKHWWLCGTCRHHVMPDDNYCSLCGTQIAWRTEDGPTWPAEKDRDVNIEEEARRIYAKEERCKPCPWCGSDIAAELKYAPPEKLSGLIRVWIGCACCGATGPRSYYYISGDITDKETAEDQAIEIWNSMNTKI